MNRSYFFVSIAEKILKRAIPFHCTYWHLTWTMTWSAYCNLPFSKKEKLLTTILVWIQDNLLWNKSHHCLWLRFEFDKNLIIDMQILKYVLRNDLVWFDIHRLQHYYVIFDNPFNSIWNGLIFAQRLKMQDAYRLHTHYLDMLKDRRKECVQLRMMYNRLEIKIYS